MPRAAGRGEAAGAGPPCPAAEPVRPVAVPPAARRGGKMRSKGRKESLSDSRDLDGSYDQLTGECRPPGKVQQPLGTTARGRPRAPPAPPGTPAPPLPDPAEPRPPARPALPHALPGEGGRGERPRRWSRGTVPGRGGGDAPGAFRVGPSRAEVAPRQLCREKAPAGGWDA